MVDINIQELAQQSYKVVEHTLSTNQFLSGGFILATLAAAWNYLRNLPGQILNYIVSKLTRSIKVNQEDAAYSWVNRYCIAHLSDKNHLSANTKWELDRKTGNYTWNIRTIPAPGKHFSWYKGIPMWIEREEPKAPSKMEEMFTFLTEKYTIHFIWWDQRILIDFLRFCQEKYEERGEEERKIEIFVTALQGWKLLDARDPRDLSSIVMSEKRHIKVYEDLKKFLLAKRRYHSLGIPYHRGYLFYGPPGNGKSSLIHALVSEMPKLDRIYTLQLNSVLSDASLVDLLASMSITGSVLVIEDIDCAFEQRKSNTKVTLSGLLNALDGLCAIEGQVVFMTTNHKDKLDPALIRAGRVDYMLEVTPPGKAEKREVFLRFCPTASEEEIQEFIENSPEGESMAAVQEKLLQKVDILEGIDFEGKLTYDSKSRNPTEIREIGH